MQTKLTLRMDSDLIQRAKEYSDKTGKSLSQIVADYFDLLTLERDTQKKGSSTPITNSLRGILKGSSVDEAAYNSYLEEKYQ